MLRSSSGWALALWLCLVTLITPAWAQQPADPPARADEAKPSAAEMAQQEMEQLEGSLDRAESRAGVLASDCASACEALAAMQRTVERICELDQGRRCEAARDKVERTRRRLLEACPECLAARDERRYDASKKPTPVERPSPAPPPERSAETLKQEPGAMKGGGAGADAPEPEMAVVESKRGGCAACAVAAPSTDERLGAIGWLLLGAALMVLRRRHRR